MGGGDGVEKVDGCVQHGMVDVEKLAAGAVEAVEGRLVGIDGGAARTQEGSRCADVGRRGGGGGGRSKRRIRRDMVYSRGERKEYRPWRAPSGPLSQRPEPLNTEFLAQLESSLVENADESVGPALLDETTRGAGSDGPAAGGGRGVELDPVIPTLFPKDRGRHEAAWCRPRRGREDRALDRGSAQRRMPDFSRWQATGPWCC